MIVVAALALSLGCESPKGAYAPTSQPEYALENTLNVVLLNSELAGSLAVEGQRASYAEDGRLQVFANIRSRTPKRLTIQVQTVFKDENGFSTGDETAWETIILTELSQTTYQSIAQNTKARRYTIRVRTLR
jgi:uncharacterized protein YcfL